MPLFNSCAIETRLPFIPGLSEYFLYANDDMFIWNPINKDFFFKDDKVVCRFGKKIRNKAYKHIYGYTISNAYNIIKSELGADIPYFPHHGIDAYKKSAFLECISRFQEKFDETLTHRFREFSDIQRIIILYYTIFKNQGIIEPMNYNWFNTLLNKTFDSEFYELNKRNIKKIINSKAKLMCINNNRKTTDADRAIIKDFFEEKFSNKSSIEK